MRGDYDEGQGGREAYAIPRAYLENMRLTDMDMDDMYAR